MDVPVGSPGTFDQLEDWRKGRGQEPGARDLPEGRTLIMMMMIIIVTV